MKQRKIAQEKFIQLYRQAEKLITKKVVNSQWAIEDPAKLIHELQTFQIELELQNQELHRSQKELMRSKIRYTELYDFAPVGYITLNEKGLILNANLTLADMLSTERSRLIDQLLSTYIFSEDQDIYYQHRRHLSHTKTRQICELRIHKNDGTPFYVQLESTTVLNGNRDQKQYRIIVIDISGRKRTDEVLAIEKKGLQEALSRVKELTGLLPICAQCKKIRDDKGYWNKIESYIEGHSETKFSHGMCPECSDALYGKEDWYIEMKKEKE